MAQNVKFIKGNTAKINGTAITDGQLLYDTTAGLHYIDVGSTRKEVGKPIDTALSTTSTNAIANNAITNSIINTTAEVSAITASNIPCGTKPVKELINSLTVITETLAIGSTSITISNSAITENSILDFYTSIYGVSPLTVTVTSGQVVLTFSAQTASMIVGVKVGGTYA